MAAASDIWLRTFAYDTGVAQRGSRLLPIELIESIPVKAGFTEGCIEFRIGGVEVLTAGTVPPGYIEDWWGSALDAAADLLALRSALWSLPGKVCHVRIDVLPGTRRAMVQTMHPGHAPLSPQVEAHVPALVGAMLDEAERFFRWLPRRDTAAERGRIGALRATRAPWTHP